LLISGFSLFEYDTNLSLLFEVFEQSNFTCLLLIISNEQPFS